MNSKIVAFIALFAVLFGCVVSASETESIKFHLYEGSSNWWVGVDPRGDRYDTIKVEIRGATESSWTLMMYNGGWPYFHMSSTSGSGFSFPLSFRLTAENGEQVVASIARIGSNILVDTGVQYQNVNPATVAPTVPATAAPTEAATVAPTVPATAAPTEAATVAPTEAATIAPTVPATAAPTEAATVAPTEAATVAPTEAATVAPTVPATVAPTVPATVAPTEAATVAPTVPATVAPTEAATVAPTVPATAAPTTAPTTRPTTAPTTRPTTAPPTAPTTRPTSAPTTAPTQAATQAPTQKPTQAATQAPTQKATQAPTQAPTQKATQAPTQAPTQKATQAPTQAPTQKATQAPSVDLCSIVPVKTEPIKILVPLYVYPGAAWDTLITAANNGAKIIAIINPNSGPNANGPDSAYTNYMRKFVAAGIEMVGYVHTSWGTRSISTVNTEIGIYATKYPGVKGIFFDEASTESKDVAYYREAYNTVLSKGFVHSILNPGVQPDKQYLDISTNIVIFENYASELSRAKYDSWVKCAPTSAQKSGYQYKFSAIIHTAGLSEISSLITQAHNLGMGLVYVTDGPGGCCTYNYLATYFAAQSTTVNQLNLA